MKKLLLLAFIILLSGGLMAQGTQKTKGDTCKTQKECKHKDTKCCNKTKTTKANPTECKPNTAGKTTVDTKPEKK